MICYRPGAYARVFGVPKELGRTTIFEIRFIRPVEDPHEVLFHLMEAIVVTLQHSRGRSPVCPCEFSSATLFPSIFMCPSRGFTTPNSRELRVPHLIRKANRCQFHQLHRSPMTFVEGHKIPSWCLHIRREKTRVMMVMDHQSITLISHQIPPSNVPLPPPQ